MARRSHPPPALVGGRARRRQGRGVEDAGACLDVTQLFQVQGELTQFVELVEHSTDFIGIAELDGRIRYINEAGRRMVGLDLEDLRSKRVGDS